MCWRWRGARIRAAGAAQKPSGQRAPILFGGGAARRPRARLSPVTRHAARRAVCGCGERSGPERRRPSSAASTSNKYLLETTGCGVAFFDYDQDDWLDIFLVNGWRLEGFRQGQGARLPSVQEQSRRHVYGRHDRRPGWRAAGWGQACCVGDYNNDGWNDLFVSYYGQNALYRNNGNGTFTDVTKEGRTDAGPAALELRLRVPRLRQGRPSGSVRRQLYRSRSEDDAAAGRRQLHLQGHRGGVRAAGARGRQEHPLSQQRRRHLQRREREGRDVGHAGHLCAELRRGRSRSTMAGPTSMSPTIPPRPRSIRTRRTARSRIRPSKRA